MVAGFPNVRASRKADGKGLNCRVAANTLSASLSLSVWGVAGARSLAPPIWPNPAKKTQSSVLRPPSLAAPPWVGARAFLALPKSPRGATELGRHGSASWTVLGSPIRPIWPSLAIGRRPKRPNGQYTVGVPGRCPGRHRATRHSAHTAKVLGRCQGPLQPSQRGLGRSTEVHGVPTPVCSPSPPAVDGGQRESGTLRL